jgi:hypothetical protein
MYVPPESGLGTREIAAMRRLSPGAFSVLAGELDVPSSWSTVRRILRDADPERALARQMAIEVDRAVAAHHEAIDSGFGDSEIPLPDDGLGNFFKRIGKAIRRHVKQIIDIHKKVIHAAEKVHAKTDLIYKAVKGPTHKRASSSASVASVASPSQSEVQPQTSDVTDWSQVGSQIVSAPSGPSQQPSIQYIQEQPPANPAAPAPTDAVVTPSVAPVSDSAAQAVPETKSGSGLLWVLLAGGAAALAAGKK